MKYRMLAALTAAALTAGLLSGCKSSTPANTLTFLNSKGEIQGALEEVADLYTKKTGITVEIIAAPAGTTPFEKISQMYTSGNPPILAMLDTTDVVQIAETRALDLSDERWVADAGSHAYRIDGKVYSFPMGIEGKGLIYNKTLIEKTLGEAFHPEEYNTLDKLTALFARLSEKGVTPMLISKEDWSLGSHYAGFLYESQSENIEDVDAFVDSLRAGKVSLIDNPRFNQLMDTFDLLAANNYYKKDPLSADYSLDPSFLTDGDVAFWFNGNWAWPNLDAFLTGLPDPPELGLMPLPLGNDENDFVNNYLIGTGSKQIIIDKVKATPEQQQMAKDFLNGLVYDEEGQAAMVTSLQMVPAFSNITLQPADPLGQSIKAYVDKNRTIFGPMLPSDHWSYVGAYMQKYLDGQYDRAGLARDIEAYWKSKGA